MNFKIVAVIVILLFTGQEALYSQVSTPAKRQFYVSPAGNDKNPGTMDQPLASLTGARDKIKALKNKSGTIVYFRGGSYAFSETCTFGQEDAGTISEPVTYRNYKDEAVFFTGGRTLNVVQFQPVKDKKILDRLPLESINKVQVIDLKAAGIISFGKLTQHGFGIPVQPAPLELFFNKKPVERAKWPNTGMVDIGDVTDEGSNFRKGDTTRRGAIFKYDFERAGRWKDLSNIWIAGLFSNAWSDDNLQIESIDFQHKTIKLKQPHLYGVKSTATDKHHVRGYYVYNLLEEIDLPGEWYLDESAAKLYFWPPASLSNATVEVSLLSKPFISLRNTAGIRFEGLSFECARGMGIFLNNTSNCTISNCVFKNLGTVAVSTGAELNGGKLLSNLDGSPKRQDTNFYTGSNNLIENCTIYQTGTGGVILSGGDRNKLLPANNKVSNCEFYNFSRINKTYSPAVDINGVGNIVSNCFIHDAPHEALSFLGNNHLIERNHFKQVCTETHDMGAVYTGRDPSCRGTKIINNFFEDIRSSTGGSVCSIYMDDGSGGTIINGNVFYKAATAGKYKFGAIFVHGGRDNVFSNNVFIECELAFGNSPWNNKKWANFVKSPLLRKSLYKDVNINSEIYKKAYPDLAQLADTSAGRPRVNSSDHSLFYGTGKFSSGKGYLHRDSLTTTTDPGFVNAAAKDFRLKPDAVVFTRLPGFKPIPFEKIGILPEYRTKTKKD